MKLAGLSLLLAISTVAFLFVIKVSEASPYSVFLEEIARSIQSSGALVASGSSDGGGNGDDAVDGNDGLSGRAFTGGRSKKKKGKNNGGTDCTSKADSGPCRALFKAYFFNTESQTCEDFFYGGCAGNGNRYKTFRECARICKRGRSGRK